MKKLALFCFAFSLLFADKLQIKSQISPVSEEWINLEERNCGDECLKKLIEDGQMASFLARFNGSNDKFIIQTYLLYTNEKFMLSKDFAQNSIAVIIPQDTIKSYTQVVSNALIGYVMRQNADLNLKFFLIGNESETAILSALNEIKSQNIKFIIAAMTNIGVNVLIDSVNTDTLVYIPTLNKKFFSNARENFIFGGIDYERQISELLAHSNGKIATFCDGSELGAKLDEYSDFLSGGVVFSHTMSGKNFDLKDVIFENEALVNSSVFLNVPIVKTALVSAQLKAYDANVSALLSTQINFDPLLFSFAQYFDIKKMLIANSISQIDKKLDAINVVLNQDLNYDWIAYSSSIAIDYIYTTFIDTYARRIFDEKINSSQVIYDTKIYKTTPFGFEEL